MRSFGMKMMASALALVSPPALAAPDAESMSIGRCSVTDEVSVYSRSASLFPDVQTIALNSDVRRGQPLPALMVDGWRPESGPADKVLADLGREAGFSVSGAGLSRVSWSGKTASLTEVVKDITRQAGLDWSFDGSVLSLSKPKPPTPSSASASVALPASRDARLAFLDIVRGHGLEVKVSGHHATLSGAEAAFSKAKTALANATQLVVFDVAFIRGRPSEGRYDWSSIGASEAAVANAGGRFAFGSMSMTSVVSSLRARGDLVVDGMQTVAAPQGWSLAVPQAQCGDGKGELILKPKLVGESLSLGVQGAGLSSQYASLNLGSVALVASSQPVNGWIQMALIRPRIVAFKR